MSNYIRVDEVPGLLAYMRRYTGHPLPEAKRQRLAHIAVIYGVPKRRTARAETVSSQVWRMVARGGGRPNPRGAG